MKPRQIHPSVVDAVELPDVVALGPNLFGVVFFLMKLIPARYILDQARQEGLLRPGSMVIETTSGTFGLALAMLCNLEGYRLRLVSDSAVDPALSRRLVDLGAEVDIVRDEGTPGGIQQARLNRLAELRAQHPDHFWPSQYENPNNPNSYARCAELLAETVGRIDCLVGTVGSGGSMCGTSRYLRVLFPDLHVIGVDTHGSVLFGLPDEKKRLLRGLGNSLMPGNVDHSAFDEIHWVLGEEGFHATRLLHRRHALYAGPTSGAAYMAAHWWAGQNPDANVAVIFPDEGYRYQETVYNDDWLRDNGIALDGLPPGPETCRHPGEVPRRWARMAWGRRTYEQVMGQAFRIG
ncbi:MAG: cysteine synthase family protein [Acidobacteriota bacterium]